MNVLSLSGWAHRTDALRDVLPEGATHFDYGRYDSVETCFAALAEAKPDVVVGWSLGGQLALRAVAAGVISPQKLILLSVPYQIAADANFTDATPLAMLQASRAAFAADAAAMLTEFQGACAFGDVKRRQVLSAFRAATTPQDGYHWLFWFDELLRFSFADVALENLPPVTLIYGAADCIVPVQQGRILAERLGDASLHELEGCAHAPHWHDAEAVRHLLAESI